MSTIIFMKIYIKIKLLENQASRNINAYYCL